MNIVKDVLERDPGSYDGHRLSGDLAFLGAQLVYKDKNQDKKHGEELLRKALAEYRKADAIKPNQPSLLLALARVLTATGDYAGAEGVYQSVIAREPERV